MVEPAGIRDSFERSYEELVEPIFRYFLFRLGDRDRSRELAQETFMRAWTYAASGKEISQMRAFLYTAAANLFKNELRAKRPVISLDWIMEASGFDVADQRQAPEEETEARMLMQRLDELGDTDREVLTLRYVDGLGNQEIATAIGIRENAVAVRIHRALKKLRAAHEGNHE